MVAVSRPAMADGEDDELLASLAAQRLRRIKVAVAARRKQVAAAVAAFSSCGQGPQGKKRREAAFSWEDHLARLTEDEFKHGTSTAREERVVMIVLGFTITLNRFGKVW